MALVVIVPFIIVFSSVVFLLNMDTLKTISAIWAPWVGAVIGYFFGTRQVEMMIQKVESITGLAEQRSLDLENEKQKFVNKQLEYERLEAELVINNQVAQTQLKNAEQFIIILLQIINRGLPK
jgi:hypothetical protein